MRVPNVHAFLAAVVLHLTSSLVPILAFPTIRVRLKVAQMLIRAGGVIALAVEFKRAQDLGFKVSLHCAETKEQSEEAQ